MAEKSGKEVAAGGASHAVLDTLSRWLNSARIDVHGWLHLAVLWSNNVYLLWAVTVAYSESVSIAIGHAGVVNVDLDLRHISLEILVGRRGDARWRCAGSAATGSPGGLSRVNAGAIGRICERWHIRGRWNVTLGVVSVDSSVRDLDGLRHSPVVLDGWLVAALSLSKTDSLSLSLPVAGSAILGDGLTDRQEEGLELKLKLLQTEVEVVSQETKELLLHKVDFGLRKAKLREVLVWCGLDMGITCPVAILWRRVVHVLGGNDQAGEKDAVGGALQALGNWRELLAKAFEVKECGHEGGDLDIGLLDQRPDELLKGRDLVRLLAVFQIRRKRSYLQIVVGQELWAWWSGGELVLLIDGWARLASDNLRRLVSEVGDHIFSNWTVEKLIHGVILILWTAWVCLVVHLGDWRLDILYSRRRAA